MPDLAFVQATSNASANNIGGTTWTISLAGTTAGNRLFILFQARFSGPFTIAVTDSQGNTWHQLAASWSFFTSSALAGGAVTVTITQTFGATTITNIAAALLEYQGTEINDYTGDFGFGVPNGSAGNVTSSPAGSGLTLDYTGVNAVWQPSTDYDATGATAPITASDTNTPAYMQFVFNSGISGATPPAWNETGGNTIDNTVTWNNLGMTPTPQGVMVHLMVGSSPWIEFPSPGAAWTLRTEAHDYNGITVYDQIGHWNASYSAAIVKSADTYDLDMSMEPLAGTLPPAAASGFIEGTFTGVFAPGHIGGGTI